jgi:tetratricopeptide (TPR) repeat protein
VSSESVKLRGKGNGLVRKARAAGWDAKLLGEAAKAYRAALKLDPKDYVALNNLAAVYSYRAAFPLAAAALKKALALKPREPAIRRNVYYMRLNMRGESGLSGGQLETLRALPKGEPGLFEVWFDPRF